METPISKSSQLLTAEQVQQMIQHHVAAHTQALSELYSSLFEKLKKKNSVQKDQDTLWIVKHTNFILNRFKLQGFTKFDGKHDRAKFQEMFQYLYTTDTIKPGNIVWNTALLHLCNPDTIEATKEIATNRVNDPPLENLAFLLAKTQDPEEEKSTMIKLSRFRFTLKDFEKELSEFKNLCSNLQPTEASPYFTALLMIPCLPSGLLELLPVRPITNVSDLANDIRAVIINRPDFIATLSRQEVDRPAFRESEDVNEDMATLNLSDEEECIEDGDFSQDIDKIPTKDQSTAYNVFNSFNDSGRKQGGLTSFNWRGNGAF